MSASKLTDLELVFIHRTRKAYLFENEDGSEVWIPRSQCEMESEDPLRGDLVTVTMPTRTAIEKGLV